MRKNSCMSQNFGLQWGVGGLYPILFYIMLLKWIFVHIFFKNMNGTLARKVILNEIKTNYFLSVCLEALQYIKYVLIVRRIKN